MSEATHRRVMRAVPKWKLAVLLAALAAAGVGAGVKIASGVGRSQASDAARADAAQIAAEGPAAKELPHSTAPPGRSFVGSAPPRAEQADRRAEQADRPESPAAAPRADDPAPSADAPTFTDRAATWLTAGGLSLFAGIVLGVMARSFVKTAAAVAAFLVIGGVVLSYFRVLPVDFAMMKSNYDSVSPWLTDHLGGLKDFVIAHLPSTSAATVGFFLGFLRK